MPEALPPFTSDTFEDEVLKSEIPVLVDFGATWCGACRALAPTLTELAKEYEGRVKFGAVDADADSGLLSKYGVSALPTVVIFVGGKEHSRSVGVVSRTKLRSMLDSALSQ